MHLANGTQCVGQGVQFILDPLQGAPDSVGTVQYINGQCVWVKLHGEGALDTGGIVPEERSQYEPFNHRKSGVGMRKQTGVRWLGTGSATSGSMGNGFSEFPKPPKPILDTQEIKATSEAIVKEKAPAPLTGRPLQGTQLGLCLQKTFLD